MQYKQSTEKEKKTFLQEARIPYQSVKYTGTQHTGKASFEPENHL
jgi:hypothetical protein